MGELRKQLSVGSTWLGATARPREMVSALEATRPILTPLLRLLTPSRGLGRLCAVGRLQHSHCFSATAHGLGVVP